MTFDKEFFQWIEQYKDVNPDTLRLKYLSGCHKSDWFAIAITQIEIRKKARNKLLISDDKSLLPEIIYPTLALEQCSSALTATLHAEILSEAFCNKSIRIADLTAGLGIDTLAFARKGHSVTAIEQNNTITAVNEYNFRNIPSITLINGDCQDFLNKNFNKFDAIFIDPSRRDNAGNRVYNIHDCTPDVCGLLPLIKNHSDYLMVKLSPMIDVNVALSELPMTTAVHIVGAEGECKELLLEIDFRRPIYNNSEDIPIIVDDGQRNRVTFTIRSEKSLSNVIYTIPENGKYLYLPSPSVMKSGAFRTIAHKYEFYGISHDSHIFISPVFKSDFPGKCYYIENVVQWSSSSARKMAKSSIHADVTARNFPLTSAQLKAKLKLQSDSSRHIFATTDGKGTPVVIFTHKVY